jgi:ribosomal protein S27AE
MIVEAMNSVEPFLGPAAVILLECVRLANEFVTLTFHHCPRKANGAADKLARHTNRSSLGHCSELRACLTGFVYFRPLKHE